MGKKRQYEKGIVHIGNLYGYHNKNGTTVIIEEEAKIIREAYYLYICGFTSNKMKDIFNEKGYRRRSGALWTKVAIDSLLRNEKYAGDAVVGKTFKENFLQTQRQKNEGQRPKYFIENSHPPIITRDVQKAYLVESARRKGLKKQIETQNINVKSTGKKAQRRSCGKYTTKYALSNRIICSNCGSFYRRTVWTRKSGKKVPVWRCINKLDNGYNACPKSVTIKEDLLLNELRSIINKLISSKKGLYQELAYKISGFTNPKDINMRINEFKNELLEIDDKISESVKNGSVLVARGVQDEEVLKEHLAQYYSQKRVLFEKLENENSKLTDIRSSKAEKIMKILDNINNSTVCLTQDELAIFIKKIVVYDTYLSVVTSSGTDHIITIEKVQ